MNAGSATTLSITTAGNYDDDEIVVFIDYNRDGDFADSGEEVYHNTNAGSAQTYSTSVTAPSTASSGNLRIRIILFDASYDSKNSCGDFDYGEVEDYTVNVSGASGPLAKGVKGEILTFPNPSDENFTVQLESDAVGKVIINIFNSVGQLVAQKKQEKGIKTLKVPFNLSLDAGVYTLQVLLNDNIWSTQHIIK